MTNLLLIILTAFSSTVAMSQDLTFSQRVNKLFFDVNISTKSASLLDSFLSISQLHYRDNGVRQWNLNVAMQMKSDKAWSSRHEFTFTESPLSGLKIEKGTIEVTLGETDSMKKILGLNWQLQFRDKVTATKYFEELKQLFDDVTTNKKFEYDKDVGHIAQFSTQNQTDVVRDIALCLGKSPVTRKYEVTLVFGTEFMDE